MEIVYIIIAAALIVIAVSVAVISINIIINYINLFKSIADFKNSLSLLIDRFSDINGNIYYCKDALDDIGDCLEEIDSDICQIFNNTSDIEISIKHKQEIQS